MARLAPLRDAWMLLTRVPLPRGRQVAHDPTAAGAAPGWFPLVGAAVGLITGAVYALLADLVGPFTAAALALGVGASVTGALHHDGLADVADAFGGGWTVERRLEVMKDSRIGTYGALALVLAFAVQAGALAAHDRTQGIAVLVAAHSLARGAVVVLMRVAPSARPAGLGASYAGRLGAVPTVAAASSALVIGALVLGRLALFAAGAAAIAVALTGVLAMRKVGGITGDVLGAAEQAAESAVLVTCAALARHTGAVTDGSWPWWR